LVVKDRLPSNSRWWAEILHAGQVVWQDLVDVASQKSRLLLVDVRFHKTLHHPAYALQPPEVSSEVHGDVETFVGGRVELELELNLPVAKAQLRWVSSVSDEAGQAAPLVLNSATGRFTTQFSVKRSGAYRIELMAPVLEALVGELNKVESQLLEHVTAARATLAAAAPTLSELAREAAEAAEEVTETRRDSLAPHVRRQVEGYFRGLSERSQQEINQP